MHTFLPHNAKGIDHERLAIEFQPGKIIVTSKDQGDCHYTVNLNGLSGILDIHETWRDPAGNRHHKTVFAMRKSDVEPLFQEIGSCALLMHTQLFRRLRIGWLAHRNISVIIGVVPTEQELVGITEKGKKGRLRFIKNAAESIIHAPEFLEDILEGPDRVFNLMASKHDGFKSIGFGFKVTDKTGNMGLFWIKNKDIPGAMARMEAQVRDIARHYAIPPEEYHKYIFLK
jgi:hypothetical protein